MGTRESLNEFIDGCRGREFVWGVHDCFTFTNNAFKAMYGKGWGDDLEGLYLNTDGEFAGFEALAMKYKRRSVLPFIDERLQRIDFAPPVGALVASEYESTFHLKYALGLSVGTKAVYLDENDITFRSFDSVNFAWVKPT